MRWFTAIVLLLFSGCLAAQSSFDSVDLESIAKSESRAFRPLHLSPEDVSGYDVKWYRCEWEIDPSVRYISGNVTTLFVALIPHLDSIVFDLDQALTVDSIKYHGQALHWVHLFNKICAAFPSPLPGNQADSVTVWYHGVPPENGSGSFVQGQHNGNPVIWTLSEPFGASDWWPCKNGLSDKADSIDIFIRTPNVYSSAGNGIIISVKSEGGKTIFHWKHRYPIAAYLVCLAVTNYSRYEQQVPFGGDTLKMVNYVYPEDSASAVGQTAGAIPMIQLYDSLFGIYPFQAEKYGHAEFGAGGGMEHQTMTFVNSFGFELVAHELAHQWFGDKITCGSWSDIWLNEGFATYLSGLCYEFLLPDWWRQFRKVRVEKIITQPGGSVYCPDTTNEARIFDSRLSYAKGAMILHQLRWITGDSVFFTALRNYISDPSLGYGFVRTADFKSHYENVYGQNLDWYFSDWFTGEGYPSYHLSWTQKSDTVTFSVTQTQSSSAVSFFEMLLPVRFWGGGHDTLVNVFNTFSGQSFSVILPFRVDSVQFDPDYQLISGNNTVGIDEHPETLAGITIFPNPAGLWLNVKVANPAGMIGYKIIAADGKAVLSGSFSGPEKKISIASLPDGYYSIVLSAGKSSVSRGFIRKR
jgi:aminopeptidase N